jgi:hypothetical protein
MKQLITLFLILSFGVGANNINEPLLALEFSVNQFQQNHFQISNQTLLKGIEVGTSVISGQIFDIETNQLVGEEYNATVSLSRREDSSSEWQSVDFLTGVSNSFEFTNLPDGEYYLSIRAGFSLEIEPQEIYMPTLWHPQGLIVDSFSTIANESILIINSENSNINANFKLVPAAILVITNDEYNGESLSKFKAINNDNDLFYSIRSITSTLIGQVSVSTTILYNYLPVGDYRLYIDAKFTNFPSLDRTSQIYGEGECYNCMLELLSGKGETVTLSKFDTKIIDVNLSKGASISGKLTFDQYNLFVPNFPYINVVNENGEVAGFTYFDSDVNPEGDYKVIGLSAGEYYLNFASERYIREPYTNKQCPSLICSIYDSIPIRVPSNQQVMEINHTLRNGTSIGGKLFDAQTGLELIPDPLNVGFNNYIEVLDENLHVVAGRAVYNGSTGSYYLLNNALENGKYYIKTGSSRSFISNRNYVNQVYPNIECEGNVCDFSQAELIDLNLPDSIQQFNFNLNRAFSISGIVTRDIESSPIQNIQMAVLTTQGLIADIVTTDANGGYKLGGLKPGSYYVRSYNGNKEDFRRFPKSGVIPSALVNQIYPNQVCTNDICPLNSENLIQITDENITGINFELNSGLSISGFVKDKIKDIGVANIEIKIYSEAGEYIESYYSDEYGYYKTAALDVGNYKLVTENLRHYENQAFGGFRCGLGECDVASSVVVALDESVGNINFELISGQDYYPQLSGLWYNQSQSGHGLQIEVIKSNGTATLYASWYVVKDGEPMWLTGTGPLNKELAFIDLYITNGNQFPPNFESNNVERSLWGTLNFKFDDLNNAVMSWNSQIEGYSDGEIELTRLSNLSKLQKDDDSIDACLSGTFYNPDQSGHGVMVEVLGENADSMVLTWFTYNDNKQFWLLATGDVNGTVANLSAIYTNGSDFPPLFDSDINETISWGGFNIRKTDDDNIEFEWSPNSDHADFGSGSINLHRLTKIEGLGCD